MSCSRLEEWATSARRDGEGPGEIPLAGGSGGYRPCTTREQIAPRLDSSSIAEEMVGAGHRSVAYFTGVPRFKRGIEGSRLLLTPPHYAVEEGPEASDLHAFRGNFRTR
jgi:hypothetical protein